MAAPTKKKADDFAKDLGYDKSYSKEEVFAELLTDSGMKKYHKVMEVLVNNKDGKEYEGIIEEGSTEKKLNVNYFNENDFKKTVPDVLFMDEVTHLNYYETAILGMVNDKMKVIALGDPNQSGAEAENGNSISGVQAVIFESPTLNMSVRADNTTKQDNLYKVTSFLKKFSNERDLSQMNRTPLSIEPYLKHIKKDIKLKYYQNHGELHGEKSIGKLSKGDVEYLVKDLKEGEKVALIS